MQILTLDIGSKSFKVACNDGDEERLFSAGRVIDDMFKELKDHSPHASHELLFVMCALQLQDKIVEMDGKSGNSSSEGVVNPNEEQLNNTLKLISGSLEELARKVKQ